MVDSSEESDSTDDGTGSKEGGSTEEDNDAELGACCITLVDFQPSANQFNPWESLKKGIYRCIPFLLKSG